MLCLLTGLKDVTIKKLQSSCVAFQSIFRKIGTFGMETTVRIAGHTCVRNFGTRPRTMPRVRLSRRALIVQKVNSASLGAAVSYNGFTYFYFFLVSRNAELSDSCDI